MAPHSSTLAWEILWMEEPDRPKFYPSRFQDQDHIILIRFRGGKNNSNNKHKYPGEASVNAENSGVGSKGQIIPFVSSKIELPLQIRDRKTTIDSSMQKGGNGMHLAANGSQQF